MSTATITVNADSLRAVMYVAQGRPYEGGNLWARIDALCYSAGYKGISDFLRNAPGTAHNPDRNYDWCDFGYGE